MGDLLLNTGGVEGSELRRPSPRLNIGKLCALLLPCARSSESQDMEDGSEVTGLIEIDDCGVTGDESRLVREDLVVVCVDALYSLNHFSSVASERISCATEIGFTLPRTFLDRVTCVLLINALITLTLCTSGSAAAPAAVPLREFCAMTSICSMSDILPNNVKVRVSSHVGSQVPRLHVVFLVFAGPVGRRLSSVMRTWGSGAVPASRQRKWRAALTVTCSVPSGVGDCALHMSRNGCLCVERHLKGDVCHSVVCLFFFGFVMQCHNRH